MAKGWMRSQWEAAGPPAGGLSPASSVGGDQGRGWGRELGAGSGAGVAGVARAGLENKGGEDEGLAVAQQTGERGPCRNSEKEWGGRRWCRVSVGRMWWGGCMEGRVLPGLGKDGAARLSRWEPLGSRDAHLEPPPQPGRRAGQFCTCPRESPRLLGPEQRLGREVARRGRAVDTRGGQTEPRTFSEVMGVAEEVFVVLKPE